MKKYLFALILFILLVATVCGCSPDITFPLDVPGVEDSSYEDSSYADGFEMELVGQSVKGGFSYWRDEATDVIYIRFRDRSGYAGHGGLTVMLDPETGLPLTYARYLALYENQDRADQE